MTRSRPKDESLINATGKNWQWWFAALDAAGMADKDHRTIVAEVKKLGCESAWWQQTITVEYERERGLRDIHQRSDGHYEISRQRTLNLPAEELIELVRNPEKRVQWLKTPLPEPQEKILSGNPLFIFPWPGGHSSLYVVVEAKGETKASITLVHRDLSGPEECEAIKPFWNEVAEKLKQVI